MKEEGGRNDKQSGWSSGLECADEKEKVKITSKQLFCYCLKNPHCTHDGGMKVLLTIGSRVTRDRIIPSRTQ